MCWMLSATSLASSASREVEDERAALSEREGMNGIASRLPTPVFGSGHGFSERVDFSGSEYTVDDEKAVAPELRDLFAGQAVRCRHR